MKALTGGTSMIGSYSNLRVGQLTRGKASFHDDTNDTESELDFSTKALVDENAPWYLKGPQVIYMDFIYLSDEDESTGSEGDVLGTTEDDFSSVEDSDNLSSSDEELVVEKKKKDGEEDEEGSEGTGDEASLTESPSVQFKSDDGGSLKSPSSKSSSLRSISFASHGFASESSRMLLNQKLAVSFDDKKQAAQSYLEKQGKKSEVDSDTVIYDLEKMQEVTDLLLNQKIALFEKDMSDYLTGKKKEDAMNETLRGASYWKVRKVLKFLKMADPGGTIIALTALLECDLDNKDNHSAIEDTGSLELFVNLLTVDWCLIRCSTLEVLDAITSVNEDMGEIIMNLGLADVLCPILQSSDDVEVWGAVRCLCNLMSIKRTRTVIRKAKLAPVIFALVHRLPMAVLQRKLCDFYTDGVMHRRYEIALGALYIITCTLRSPRVREEMFHIGYLTIVTPLLNSRERFVVKAVLEGILLCASLRKYRQRFEINHTIKTVLKHWKKYEEIVLYFLYKMSIGVEARAQIIEFDGLTKVIEFVQNDANIVSDPYGFKHALACLHRMGANAMTREIFHDIKLIDQLIKLLKLELPDPYKVEICGIISQLSIFPENWKVIVDSGGLEALLNIIFTRITDVWLLAHSLKILSDVAHGDEASTVLLEHPETLPYLLNMLSDERPLMIRCIAQAVVPLTRIYKNCSELIKGDQDSLEVLVERLKHNDNSVRTAVCEALAAVITDQSILEILHDMGLMSLIGQLVITDDQALQENVCMLVSMCANNEMERNEFENCGIAREMAKFLASPNIHVVIAAVTAFWKLSFDPRIAKRLAETGIVQQLIGWSQSQYTDLSDAALGVLRNIRFAADLTEKAYRGLSKAVVIPPSSFPLSFKPQVFFYDEIELSKNEEQFIGK